MQCDVIHSWKILLFYSRKTAMCDIECMVCEIWKQILLGYANRELIKLSLYYNRISCFITAYLTQNLCSFVLIHIQEDNSCISCLWTHISRERKYFIWITWTVTFVNNNCYFKKALLNVWLYWSHESYKQVRDVHRIIFLSNTRGL